MKAMKSKPSVLPAFALASAALFGWGLESARAIDICGNGICSGGARPPETCSSCPADCGPCAPPPPPPAVFSLLKDSSDALPGKIVVSGIQAIDEDLSPGTFGQERIYLGLAIAVDPTNSSRVYVAWADEASLGALPRLHVRRSDNRGVTWSSSDLLTVTNATNPALAVNNVGKVAFLYQQNDATGVALANQRWQTHVRRSTDLGGSWSDLTLANTPAAIPTAVSHPYLGSFADIRAVGSDFYGAFSASNVPDLANFPQGVTYARRANFTTHQLLQTDNVTPVAPSIDPFFFHLREN